MVRDEVFGSIDRELEKQNPSTDTLNTAATLRQSMNNTESAVNEIRRLMASFRKQFANMQASNSIRRSHMSEGFVFTNKVAERQYAELKELDNKSSTKDLQSQESRGHIRRAVQTLCDIFTITPIEDRPLCFEICGQYLPNADDLYATGKHAPTEQGIAAALGYVTSLMDQLAQIIEFAFPYPIKYLGSNSTIEDPITKAPSPSGVSSSSANAKRVYPLFQTGTKRPDFEYAVYLLNQNILGLMANEGLRVVNPKTTLANLKYLIEVLTSGKGDVPERKKGKNVLEAVGVSKVNVEGEIVNDGHAVAAGLLKVGEGSKEISDDLNVTSARWNDFMADLRGLAGRSGDGPAGESGADGVSGPSTASGTENPSAADTTYSTTSASSVPAAANFNFKSNLDTTFPQPKGKGKPKAEDSPPPPYPGPRAHGTMGDETGFEIAVSPSKTVVQRASVTQKIDSRTPFSYVGREDR